VKLEQSSKLFQAQSGIPDNASQSECVDGIMAGNRQDSYSIRHDDVRALTQNAEACFFQRGNGSKMVDSGDFGHDLFRL
jgi:hypothetical protein